MDCFLCSPNPALRYADSDSFFAMLGWGPIGEGYSLIAAKEHRPSMFDLPKEMAEELEVFTHQVKTTLTPLFGAPSITEHGRVAACVEAVTAQHEPHCLHAHRLVFPGLPEIDVRNLMPRPPWKSFSTFLAAYAEFSWEGQYLYAESAEGACSVAPIVGPVPRQLFRGFAAKLQGMPGTADWKAAPDFPTIEAAAHRLELP